MKSNAFIRNIKNEGFSGCKLDFLLPQDNKNRLIFLERKSIVRHSLETGEFLEKRKLTEEGYIQDFFLWGEKFVIVSICEKSQDFFVLLNSESLECLSKKDSEIQDILGLIRTSIVDPVTKKKEYCFCYICKNQEKKIERNLYFWK